MYNTKNDVVNSYIVNKDTQCLKETWCYMSKIITVEKILGVDQSINCTGVCLHTIETDHSGDKPHEYHSYQYWLIPANNKCTKKMLAFSNPWITIDPYKKMDGEDYVSKEVAKTMNIYAICDIIESIIQTEKPDTLVMEGISYGSRGSAALVDLAGLNYCIRMMAIRRGLGIAIVSPTSLKMRATGNGGAEKEEMIWAWKQCDTNIADVKEIKIDDLADAFFLSKCQ